MEVLDEAEKAFGSARAAGEKALREARIHLQSALRHLNLELQEAMGQIEHRNMGPQVGARDEVGDDFRRA